LIRNVVLFILILKDTLKPFYLGGYKVEKENVIVLDFGGQYNQLIARRVRECNVYCEVLPYTTSLEKIKELAPKGIIFTEIESGQRPRNLNLILLQQNQDGTDNKSVPS
jgi:hypothetical protein